MLQRAVEQGQEHSAQQWAEDAFHYQGHSSSQHSRGGLASGYGDADDEQRRRVRLIECQFRMPASVRVVTEGPFKGAFVEPWDQALMQAIGQAGGAIVDRVVMRMHVAVFTEGHLLALGPMPMRHNSFSLTPIWLSLIHI